MISPTQVVTAPDRLQRDACCGNARPKSLPRSPAAICCSSDVFIFRFFHPVQIQSAIRERREVCFIRKRLPRNDLEQPNVQTYSGTTDSFATCTGIKQAQQRYPPKPPCRLIPEAGRKRISCSRAPAFSPLQACPSGRTSQNLSDPGPDRSESPAPCLSGSGCKEPGSQMSAFTRGVVCDESRAVVLRFLKCCRR